uniref:Uncharacterized protein n=1 Tax=Cyprinus carpio carpio TaxID=630221 RepID=A0A9J8CV40_CYPCA
NWRKLKRAAKLLLCRLACIPSFFGGVLLERLLMIPVHLFICFCRYFRWLTFLLDLTGLSSASLMLLEAESMKLSRSLVPGKQKFKNCEFMMRNTLAVNICNCPRETLKHISYLHFQGGFLTLGPVQYTLTVPLQSAENWNLGEGRIILGGRANDVRTSKGRGRGTRGLNSLLTPDHLQLRGICLRHPTE